MQTESHENGGGVEENHQVGGGGMAQPFSHQQEFDREQGSVVGIAVEHHNLRPGESTSVYVIRRGETP